MNILRKYIDIILNEDIPVLDTISTSKTGIVYDTSFEEIVYDSDPIKARESLEALAQYINTNCQPWLSQVDKRQIAYRGIRSSRLSTDHGIPINRLSWMIRDIRQDRTPLDSNQWQTELFNSLLHIAGTDITRTNSLFVSGNYSRAEEYGDVLLVVLPVGNFNIAWSRSKSDWFFSRSVDRFKYFIEPYLKSADEIVSDIYSDIAKEHKIELPLDTFEKIDKFYNMLYIEAVNRTLDVRVFNTEKIKYDIMTSDIRHALDIGNEVMIKANKAVLIPYEVYRRYLAEFK